MNPVKQLPLLELLFKWPVLLKLLKIRNDHEKEKTYGGYQNSILQSRETTLQGL